VSFLRRVNAKALRTTALYKANGMPRAPQNTLHFNTFCNNDRAIFVGGGVIAGTLVASLIPVMS
jgi:hypothetical protein